MQTQNRRNWSHWASSFVIQWASRILAHKSFVESGGLGPAQSARRGKLILASTVAAVLLIPLLMGCRSTTSPPTRYVLAATLAGYHIQASLDRPATIESRDDHVLITFGYHRLRVEKGWVVLDDNEKAAFPTTATQIAIEITRGTLRMTADGHEMWKGPFITE